jgi:hypothetical protein
MSYINQTTQYIIRELFLEFSNGEKIDIKNIIEEINLFDNLFTPCVSGNILLSDAVGLSEKLKLQGSEKLKVTIEKTENFDEISFEKQFVLYKLTERKNINLNSQAYVIHFVSEEFILSEQKKVSQNFVGSYSTILKSILTNYLKVQDASPVQGKGGIGIIYPSAGPQDIIIPNLTPFDAINFISKRAIALNYNTPDFCFYETIAGYNFAPLKYLMSLDPVFNINFKPKNLSGDNMEQEFLGARDLKVLSQFSVLDNIRDGSYAGKFIGFDTLTRTFKVTTVKTVYEDESAGSTNNLADAYNKENKKYEDMAESRIVSYPFALPRSTVAYIKENNPANINFADNSEEYVFQRKSIFSNLTQRRLQLTMPGNFGLFSGRMVYLSIPKYSISDKSNSTDRNLSGNYLITAVRHVIRFDKHETLIEVSTDKIEN